MRCDKHVSHIRWSVVAADVNGAADAVAVVDTSATIGADGITLCLMRKKTDMAAVTTWIT